MWCDPIYILICGCWLMTQLISLAYSEWKRTTAPIPLLIAKPLLLHYSLNASGCSHETNTTISPQTIGCQKKCRSLLGERCFIKQCFSSNSITPSSAQFHNANRDQQIYPVTQPYLLDKVRFVDVQSTPSLYSRPRSPTNVWSSSRKSTI